MEYSSINKKKALVWFFARLIGFVAALVCCAGAYFIANAVEYEEGIVGILTAWYILSAVLMAVFIIYAFIMPFLQQRQWKYIITDDRIEVRYGVIVKMVQIVPQSRIQHITMARMVVDRIFGLASVTVTTASSNISIIGLTPSQAEAIIEKVNLNVNYLVNEEASQ